MIRGSGLVLQANVVQHNSRFEQEVLDATSMVLYVPRSSIFLARWQMLDIYAVIMQMLCCSMRGIKMQVIQTNKRNGKGFEQMAKSC